MTRLTALLCALSACKPIVLGDRVEALDASGGNEGTAGSVSVERDGSVEPTRDAEASDAALDAAPPDASVALPIPGAVLWSSDHESGDLSSWEQGGTAQGGAYYWGTGKGQVLAGIGRNASRGLMLEIETTPDSPSHGARFYRRIQNGGAFYRAWFRLEEAHTALDWWAIFVFHAREPSLSLEDYTSLWDVRIATDASGALSLQFFDHDSLASQSAGELGRIEVKQWFEIAAYLEYRPPDATRLVIWLDDTPVFDLTGLKTVSKSDVFWIIGNGAGVLTPAHSTLVVDDAAILRVQTP